MKQVFLNALAFLFILSNVTAQIQTPQASPTSEFSTSVGLTDVTINYSRPGVKDRTVFAEDGLVPFGEIWRTGANSATKITFSDDVNFGGIDVPAGEYAILTVPSATSWQVMLHPYEGSRWTSYSELKTEHTFLAKSQSIDMFTETFTISVGNARDGSATIDMMWENTLVSIPLKVSSHEQVMADIKRTLSGPSAGEYYTAARYLHENTKQIDMALKYVQIANEGDSARFWTLRREALILADLDRFDEAIEVATRSMQMAEKAENMDYVRMNQASIEEWTGK